MKNKIKQLIKESNLSWEDKMEAELLLDKASRTEKNQKDRFKLDYLKELYKEVSDPDQKEALLEAIEEWEWKIRKTDIILEGKCFSDYTPMIFGDLLKKFGEVEESCGKIILKPNDPSLLDREIKIFEDDGMGYSPKGFNEVFDGYLGDDKNIHLWTT